MAGSRANEWETNHDAYSEDQVEAVLDALNIEIVTDTHTHFMCLCPFHGNTDTPAFAVHKDSGLWICFNPACEVKGNLSGLVREIKKINQLSADLFIAKRRSEKPVVRKRSSEVPKEFPRFSEDKFDELHRNFVNYDRAREYMHKRGFNDDTLEYFNVGYSPARIGKTGRYRPEMVTVPMHDIKGQGVGLIGRSIADKQFKNSTGLPKRYTTFNIHRARKAGGTVVVVEASFDAMRVHQVGYPNVVAFLGNMTQHHVQQLDRYFSKIIIMTDFEQRPEDMTFNDNCRACRGECSGHRPGRELGRKLQEALVGKRVLWAAYDDGVVYPHMAKDPGDMSDDEIRQCLRNAVHPSVYRHWGVDT